MPFLVSDHRSLLRSLLPTISCRIQNAEELMNRKVKEAFFVWISEISSALLANFWQKRFDMPKSIGACKVIREFPFTREECKVALLGSDLF